MADQDWTGVPFAVMVAAKACEGVAVVAVGRSVVSGVYVSVRSKDLLPAMITALQTAGFWGGSGSWQWMEGGHAWPSIGRDALGETFKHMFSPKGAKMHERIAEQVREMLRQDGYEKGGR